MKVISFSEIDNDLHAVLDQALYAEDAVTVMREDGASFVVLTRACQKFCVKEVIR